MSGGDVPDTVDIEDEIAELAGTLNVVNARLVAVVERAIASGEWRGDRIHSPAQWLAWRMGLSTAHARQIVAVAEQRSSFPTVMHAFERGELAIDQVGVVVTRAPAWADAKVLDFARAATVHQLRRMMRSEHFEGGGSQPEAGGERKDRLSSGHTEGGRWRLNAEVDCEGGTTIDAAIDEVKDDLFRSGDVEVTRAQALVELARRYLANLSSPTRRGRYRAWIHLDADADATLTAGRRLPSGLRDRILCDATVQPVWERNGVPVSVGRAQHIVPDRTRRAVEHRDRGCRAPGCTCDRFVEVHHIKHWIDGGTTDTHNLLSLCRRHHRLHHQGLLGIMGNADRPDGVTFTDHAGRVIEPNGRAIVPLAPPPEPATRYEHPEGAPINRDWVGLGWVHPDEHARRRAIASGASRHGPPAAA